MADRLSPAQRSAHMARIRGRHTKPEVALRRWLWAQGYRYRLHGKELPGRPDITFKGRKKVVFVHGCFWHQHEGCKTSHIPKTRSAYWAAKFAGNKARDTRNEGRLRELGYAVEVVWECEVVDPGAQSRLAAFLGPLGAGARIAAERDSGPKE